jgi:hypothetical protein
MGIFGVKVMKSSLSDLGEHPIAFMDFLSYFSVLIFQDCSDEPQYAGRASDELGSYC